MVKESETKEMNYEERFESVLYMYIDTDNDIELCIINRAGWPCTYIRMPEKYYENNVKNGWDSGEYFAIDVDVHGGITYGKYGDMMLHREDGNWSIYALRPGYWFGWDYTHFGDYFGHMYRNASSDHIWTIEKLKDEAFRALSQLKENRFSIRRDYHDKEH